MAENGIQTQAMEQKPAVDTNKQSKPPTMDDKNIRKLRENRVLLTKTIIMNQLLNHLIADGVIDLDEKQHINRNDATDLEKVERLIELMEKKPNEAYYKLIEGLRRTGQEHIVDGILEKQGLC